VETGFIVKRENSMAIVWTSDWNTGIGVIDEQHKRIADYINDLENAIKQQKHSSVGAVLNELVDYTHSHFAFEESLLQEAGYEFTKAHQSVHKMFVTRIQKYQDRHNAGEDIAEQLYGMLGTWLYQHIKRDDMAYVNSVQGNLEKLLANKKESGWLKRSLSAFFG
jgi:hemerythrin